MVSRKAAFGLAMPTKAAPLFVVCSIGNSYWAPYVLDFQPGGSASTDCRRSSVSKNAFRRISSL